MSVFLRKSKLLINSTLHNGPDSQLDLSSRPSWTYIGRHHIKRNLTQDVANWAGCNSIFHLCLLVARSSVKSSIELIEKKKGTRDGNCTSYKKYLFAYSAVVGVNVLPPPGREWCAKVELRATCSVARAWRYLSRKMTPTRREKRGKGGNFYKLVIEFYETDYHFQRAEQHENNGHTRSHGWVRQNSNLTNEVYFKAVVPQAVSNIQLVIEKQHSVGDWFGIHPKLSIQSIIPRCTAGGYSSLQFTFLQIETPSVTTMFYEA